MALVNQSTAPESFEMGEHSGRCVYCMNIVILPQTVDNGNLQYIPYRHQPSFLSLVKSAKAGCDLCSLFRDRLLPHCHQINWDVTYVLIFSDEQLQWTGGSISISEYSQTTHLTVSLVTEELNGRQRIHASTKFGLFQCNSTSAFW
jgi:hypothetical protein